MKLWYFAKQWSLKALVYATVLLLLAGVAWLLIYFYKKPSNSSIYLTDYSNISFNKVDCQSIAADTADRCLTGIHKILALSQKILRKRSLSLLSRLLLHTQNNAQGTNHHFFRHKSRQNSRHRLPMIAKTQRQKKRGNGLG